MQQTFVLHTQKNTSFVLHTQKSTQTDFCTAYSKKHVCTAYSKKHVICTAHSKKHSKSRQKGGKKLAKKDGKKVGKKYAKKVHCHIHNIHSKSSEKNTSLSIFLNLSCCCLETGLKPVLFYLNSR